MTIISYFHGRAEGTGKMHPEQFAFLLLPQTASQSSCKQFCESESQFPFPPPSPFLHLNYQRAATLLEIGPAGLQPLDGFISSDLSVSLPACLPPTVARSGLSPAARSPVSHLRVSASGGRNQFPSSSAVDARSIGGGGKRGGNSIDDGGDVVTPGFLFISCSPGAVR